MTSQGQYCSMLHEAICIYVTKAGDHTSTVLRGIKDSHPRSIMENFNPLSLVFQDYYKFDNRNPISNVFDARLRRINSRLVKIENEKRLQRERDLVES